MANEIKNNLLVQPSDIQSQTITAGLLYGQPGAGKSTLALSGPAPAMVDADNGIHRVQPRWRVPTLPLHNYEDVLKLFNSGELDHHKCLVIDTLGRLVERIGEYVIRRDSKNGRAGGVPTQQGWGQIKIEFQNFLRLAKAKGIHLVFVAHEKEEKDGEIRIVRPDVVGSSGKELLKDLDYVGYMEIRGNTRTISFTPSEKYYAKNALKLPEVLELPNTDSGASNDFIQKQIIERTEQNNKDQREMNRQYDELVKNNAAIIAAVKGAADANELIGILNEAKGIWDSTRVAKKALLDRAAELKLVFDKEAKAFVKTPAENIEDSSGDFKKEEPEVKEATIGDGGDKKPAKKSKSESDATPAADDGEPDPDYRV